MFCWAFTISGILSSAIAFAQVFTPEVLDGEWIAISGLPGRAIGNLRQPNHLSSLLLTAVVALVPLVQSKRLLVRYAAPLLAFFVTAIVLSASRTGTVAMVVLGVWGLLDRRLSRQVRLLLIASPLIYVAAWWGLDEWAKHTAHTFGGAERVKEADISSSRFGIWSNAWGLIRQQPWLGVGMGEFNFAWSLTPFPGRPTAFFDHTHNIVLQLAVELGLPLAALVMGLLLWALWQAWVRSGQQPDGEVGARSAFIMVLLMGLHSLLEYPLWYAYFLLPTAWAFGYALGSGKRDEADAPVTEAEARRGSRALLVMGMAVSIGGLVALADYMRVVMVFQPPAGTVLGYTPGPLEERIRSGQNSWFFGYHADYAAATADEITPAVDDALTRATHYLLDTRLMMAWAKALARRGDLDRASYIAERLREFRNPASDEFFAVCADTSVSPQPFQCRKPAKALTWRDFKKP